MTINLIIISRYNTNEENQTFIDYIKSLNLTTPENTSVVYPSDTLYETNLIAPLLKIEDGFYNLIIYDWSKTLLNEADINGAITGILTNEFDIVYLGKYLDTCSNYSPLNNISGTSSTLVTGTDPIGFNALIMSKNFSNNIKPYFESSKYYSVSYAINNYKIDNTVIDFATSPNLFVYNPLYNSVDLSNVYNIKSTECQGLMSQLVPPSDNDLLIFWVIIIIIGICLIFWIILNFTSFGVSIKENKIKINQNA